MNPSDNHYFRRGLAVAAMVASVASPAVAQEGSASGEVRRVDVAGGKITLKHEAIPSLGLPAMNLVYRADPALLADVQPGDKVTFTARRDGDQYIVIKLSK